jgi:hypothetical protein
LVDGGGRTYQALGLFQPESGETVVELDNYGIPLPADGRALELIGRIEEQWPQPVLAESDLGHLMEQLPETRYLLLARLAAEGSPAPELFHILPWSDVETVCGAVLDFLRGGPAVAAQELGHLFTPAVSGVTGPLEQLHLGLLEADADLVRFGSTALCHGAYLADVRRLPHSTARALADVITLVGSSNPFLNHIARVAAARLTGGSPFMFVARHTRALAMHGSSADVRNESREFADGSPLSVVTQVNRAGTLNVAINYAVPADARREQLLESYATVFHQVMITTEEGEMRYWVPLEVRQHRLSGSMHLSAPTRFDVQADLAPVGVRELRDVAPDDLRPSVWAADNAGKAVWLNAAAGLSKTHPIKVAVDAATRAGWR